MQEANMTTTKQLQKRIEALEEELARQQAYAERLKPTSDPMFLQAVNELTKALSKEHNPEYWIGEEGILSVEEAKEKVYQAYELYGVLS